MTVFNVEVASRAQFGGLFNSTFRNVRFRNDNNFFKAKNPVRKMFVLSLGSLKGFHYENCHFNCEDSTVRRCRSVSD